MAPVRKVLRSFVDYALRSRKTQIEDEDDDEYEDEEAAPPKYARDCSIAIPVNLSP